MRLKIEDTKPGIHPSEVIVSLKTSDGSGAKLVVHQRSIRDNSLEIGYPINQESDSYLVELPRETTTGAWRIWVPKDYVTSAG